MRPSHLQRRLHLGLSDAPLCDGKVGRVNLDPDKVASGLNTGDASRARTHKRIKNDISLMP